MNLHDSHVIKFYIHEFARYDSLINLELDKSFQLCAFNFCKSIFEKYFKKNFK